MFAVLRQIVKACKERTELSERIHREMSLPSGTVVHIREVESGQSIETCITVLDADNIRRYSIAKSPGDINEVDLRNLLSPTWP
jgi:hypothetical protein